MLDLEEAAARTEGGRARRRRRLWSAQDKQRIVAETLEPGASVSLVARRHDVNANMLFTWRREAREAPVGRAAEPPAVTFVPARITAEPTLAASSTTGVAGRMEVVLAGGERVIVGADVDASALARVIKVLSRR
jgi:transposase